MPWSDIVASGGKPNYRLSIEGWPDEWVTHADIAGTASDGRQRREGLSYEGLVLEEQADLRARVTKASSMTVTIRSPHALAAFATRPTYLCQLRADASDSATSLTVTGTTNISVNDYVHLHSEAMKVTAKGGSSPNFTLTVIRQQWGTKAQKHFYKESGLQRMSAHIHNRPRSMNGRRAILYAYSEDETGTSENGTQIWMGIVDTGPELDPADSLTWTIAIRPITDLLDNDLAQLAFEPTAVKGVYYSAMSPLAIRLSEHDTVSPRAAVNTGTLFLTGHYDDKRSMIVDLNTELDTLISGWNMGNISVSLNSDGQLKFYVQMGSTVKTPHMRIYSPHDGAAVGAFYGLGWFDQDGQELQSGDDFSANQLYSLSMPHATGDAFGFLSLLDQPMPAEYIVPSTIRDFQVIRHLMVSDQSAASTAPANRVHLEGVSLKGLTVGDSVTIENVAVALGGGSRSFVGIEEGRTVQARITAVNGANDWIELEDVRLLGGGSGLFVVCIIGPDSVVRQGRQVSGNVHDFLDGLVAESVNVNLGHTVLLTSDDIAVGASSEWEDTVDGVRASQVFYHNRIWAFDRGVELNKVLEHDLKLLGLMMRLTSDGKIGVTALRHASSADSGTVTISKDHVLTPPYGAWPRWSLSTEGLVNVVEYFQSSSNAETSKDPDFVAKDISSLAENRNRGAGIDQIKPISYPKFTEQRSILENKLIDIAAEIFSFFATDYHVIKIDVLPTLFSNALVGTTVLLTCDHVPDAATGTMGVTDLPAIIIGRRWNLDPANSEPFGTLTLIAQRDVPSQGDTIYSPSARITAAVNNTGNDWTCTVSANKYAPAGRVDASYFEANYEVNVTQFDVRNPLNEQTGHVSSVSGNDIRIVFDGTAPWGGTFSGVYDINFVQASSSAVVVGDQSKYAYNADGDLLMYDTSLEPNRLK